jgi:hypothetical protein
VSAFLGAVGGVVIFLLVRPALAGAALVGTQYFESQLTPTIWGYLAMLVGVPVIAALAALISLRRVQISPLGVSRRATPKPPGFWRLIILVLGVGLYVYGLSKTTHNSIGAQAYPGLLLKMIGLVIAGPWLTSVTSRLVGRLAPGSSALLATRRLADNPNRAFRSVTGLVLAVFLGTMVGAIIPAINSTEASPANAALSNVLLDQVGLDPHAGAKLLSGLDGIPGAFAYPLYSLTGGGDAQIGPGSGPGDTAVSCAVMRALAVLGQCAHGLQAVQTSDGSLFVDNPMYNTKPFVDSTNPAYTGKLSSLPLQTVLVRVNSPTTLERVRTYLTVNTAPKQSGGQGDAPTPPRTFGETLQIRLARATTLEKIVYAAVALTLIVAGCSLAVAVGGGLVDRKRPFTLLRVSGTPVGVLSKVVLLEAAVPLLAATVVAAGIAYGTSILAFVRLAPPGTAVPQLGSSYYALMGIGLVVAFGIIALTLPLLRRMTVPGNVRFE